MTENFLGEDHGQLRSGKINDYLGNPDSVGDVTRVLEPIWREKPETASRPRGRIEQVLDYATARGWRKGDNPAEAGSRPAAPAPLGNRPRSRDRGRGRTR